MKKKLSRNMLAMGWMIGLICAILLIQYFFFFWVDESTRRLKGFYSEPKDSLDVVFLGASDVFTGFSSGYAYDQFGFTSYAYAMHSNPPSLHKAELKEIQSRQSPQLLIVEVNGFLYKNDGYINPKLGNRRFFESAPFSKNKLETYLSLNSDHALHYLFPILRTHSNWKETEKLQDSLQYRLREDNKPTFLKGVTSRALVAPQEPAYDASEGARTVALNEEYQELLIEFMEYCRKEEMENVIFVCFPYAHTSDDEYDDRFARVNRIEQLITERGFPFINYEKRIPEIGIDYAQDFYDWAHLNVYGQKKLTQYIGDQIVNQFHVVPMAQTDDNRERWNASAAYHGAYFRFLEKKIQEGDNVWFYETPESIGQLQEIAMESMGISLPGY